MRKLYFIAIFIFVLSCSKKDALELALDSAGENKIELEQVLTHYNSPKDSLKYRAACFLIENMQYHCHYENKEFESRIKEMYLISKKNNLLAGIAVDSIENKYGKFSNLQFEKKEDIKSITSGFLIENIDTAFEAWKVAKWKNQLSFDQFCEEILPYKIAEEPIELWRRDFYNYFRPILDSLHKDSSSISACQIIYDELMKKEWKWTSKLKIPGIGAKTLFHNRIGGCTEQASLLLFAMRSVGIPGGIDKTIQNPIRPDDGHLWNYMKDKEGNIVEFLLEDPWRPMSGLRDTIRKKGVVYRMNFSRQKQNMASLYPDKNIPLKLKNIFLSNVSSEYYPKSKISISIEDENANLVYLCTYNNTTWIPVVGTPVKNNKATFWGVEPNIVYLAGYYKGQRIIPITHPFILEQNNKPHYCIADTTNLIDRVSITRKHPLSHTLESYKDRAVGGKFQTSNNVNFENCFNMFEITEKIDLNWQTVDLDQDIKYQYVRYLSGDDGFCNMAEIKFYSQDEELKGDVIGSDNYIPNDRYRRDKFAVFDDDPITFYDAVSPSSSWVGLDFEKKVSIDRIEYLFRNDDNMIREGDLYELFYFMQDGMKSLGKKYGTKSTELIFENVPTNALLLLHNHTRGKEERIFTYDLNKMEQIWW